MAFRGLFIGIDRYASPDINWLSCARRDALALHALFTDTLGTGATLLTDADATRSEIKKHFDLLAACDEDDLVVISFSGHGSDTHELITYDADITNLASSCIGLDVLTEWFSNIPAKRLVCILDCCFSGGMGAKVLHSRGIPRQIRSTQSLLDQLSGEGRLILTASTATEPAWEHPRLGHGLLTHFLLEALQGAEEVRQAGKVSIYRLLEYVTQRVIASAAQLGQSQQPTLRGQMDGALTWPIFTPGPTYFAEFPNRIKPLVTASLDSLIPYGFPRSLLDAWADVIPTLNTLQLSAINDFGILDGDHVVVSAPTSSGKTLIGELAALKGALDHKRTLFLLPLKALVNDKHQQFTKTYAPFGLRIIRATGETIDDVPTLMQGRYDIALLTYEKFAALVLGNPHLLNQVGTIVIDEVQMIADASRGINLEFLLTLLRMRRRVGIEPQIIALSAVIGATNGLERWLDARLLRRNERPVPLNEGILATDGSFRFLRPDGSADRLDAYIEREYRKSSSQDWLIPLVRRLVHEGQQVIVFRETRGEARGCATYLANALELPPARVALEQLPAGDPSQASTVLKQCLQGGVAFHISDLDREERLVIEEQFRLPDSNLRVIVATTTLAMGVNTPASAVVIAGLEHPGAVPYSIAEYKNIIGRAGRLGFAEEGTSYVLALSYPEEQYVWNHYVQGVPEDIHSQFLVSSTDPRSLIVRVLAAVPRSAANASTNGMSSTDIIDFLESSFGVFQQVQTTPHWQWDRSEIFRALGNLESHKLIERTATGTYILTALGRLTGEAGVEVESVTRIVEALRLVDPITINDPALLALVQITKELDALYFPINKKSTQKEPGEWFAHLRGQGVPGSILTALQKHVGEQHQATLRAKKTVACLLWITEWPLSTIERSLTQFGGALDGAAGPVRGVTARTYDLLPTVARIVEILFPEIQLDDRITRLLTRLEVGVPGVAVDLARESGSRLSRGDYQALIKARCCAIEALEATTDEELLVHLEGNSAKVTEVRRATLAFRQREEAQNALLLVLPAYEE